MPTTALKHGLAIVGPAGKLKLRVCERKLGKKRRAMMYTKALFGFQSEPKKKALFEWMKYHHRTVGYEAVVVG